jgi:hypothetical protein
MRPRLYTVTRAGAGRLSIMAHPRGGDWLAEELLGGQVDERGGGWRHFARRTATSTS